MPKPDATSTTSSMSSTTNSTPKTLWTDTPATGPSAGLVQEHFKKIRLAELERRGPTYEKKIRETLERELNLRAPKKKLLSFGNSGEPEWWSYY